MLWRVVTDMYLMYIAANCNMFAITCPSLHIPSFPSSSWSFLLLSQENAAWLNPSGANSGIFQENQVKSIVADVLVSFICSSSAVMALSLFDTLIIGFHETGAMFQCLIRRRMVRSRKVSKPRYLYLELFDSSEIWQASRQQCCRGVCQIAKQCDDLNYQSRGFDALWDPTISRVIGYWNGAPISNTCTNSMWRNDTLRNGKVFMVTTLVFTANVEACLRRLLWRPGHTFGGLFVSLHWKSRVIMALTLRSSEAHDVVIPTTTGANNDENSGIMTTLGVQCRKHEHTFMFSQNK